MNEDSEFNTPISKETVTLKISGWLNSLDCNQPFVTFQIQPELAQFYAPLEYTAYVPPTIRWPYYSCGKFAVDISLTFNPTFAEVVSIDSISPNPSLPGGF